MVQSIILALLMYFTVGNAVERQPLIASFLKYTNTPLSMINDDTVDSLFNVATFLCIYG